MDICRQCFREKAAAIGFVKVRFNPDVCGVCGLLTWLFYSRTGEREIQSAISHLVPVWGSVGFQVQRDLGCIPLELIL